jgi:hypothetical protein
MLAASVMELSSGFSLLRSAPLSIQRFAGGLPIDLLRRGVFGGRSWYLLALTILISITTLSSTFISTALVSDLEIASNFGGVVLGSTAYSLNYTKGQLLAQYDPNFTTILPATYPAFGEYTIPISESVEGVDDTGPGLRAFLPISSATARQTLSNYTGPGTVLNTHVVCLKPTMSNITLVTGGGPLSDDPPYVTGFVRVKDLPPGLSFHNSTPYNPYMQPTNFVAFTCFLSYPIQRNDEWPLSMCAAGNYFADFNKTGKSSSLIHNFNQSKRT